MPDYQQGKIYKLVCDKTDKFYIGSTTQTLSKRLIDHNSGYKCYLLKKSKYVSSYDLCILGDIRIILIEECPCDNLNQLKARERHHIDINKLLLVNRNIPNRTKAECDKAYSEKNKEHLAEKHKEYYQDNKEKLLTKATEYRENNEKKVSDCKKDWYRRNKEKVLAQRAEFRKRNPDANKNYYQANKDILLSKRIKKIESRK
jgi:hypothetical protein